MTAQRKGGMSALEEPLSDPVVIPLQCHCQNRGARWRPWNAAKRAQRGSSRLSRWVYSPRKGAPPIWESLRALPDPLLREKVYFYAIVRPAQAVINTVAPSERVLGAENHLESTASRLDIVRGCDGAGFAFLLIAAITGWPAWSKPDCVPRAGERTRSTPYCVPLFS